jgi:hypothetical protein
VISSRGGNIQSAHDLSAGRAAIADLPQGCVCEGSGPDVAGGDRFTGSRRT